MKNNYGFIAEVFKKRRIMFGYSKRKLASIVGISDTEISRIEHGERENYNLVTLIRMCEVLKIDFVHLLVLAGYLPSKEEEKNRISEMENILDEEESIEKTNENVPIEISITLVHGIND